MLHHVEKRRKFLCKTYKRHINTLGNVRKTIASGTCLSNSSSGRASCLAYITLHIPERHRTSHFTYGTISKGACACVNLIRMISSSGNRTSFVPHSMSVFDSTRLLIIVDAWCRGRRNLRYYSWTLPIAAVIAASRRALGTATSEALYALNIFGRVSKRLGWFGSKGQRFGRDQKSHLALGGHSPSKVR